MNTEFQFQAGDIVTYYPYGDKEFELMPNDIGAYPFYPFKVMSKGTIYSLTSDGKTHSHHELPSIKLLRRPSVEVTWYQVIYHLTNSLRPYVTDILYESKENFLAATNSKESDHHWIELKKVVTR